MPTHTQGVVEIKGEPSSRSLGARDDAVIKKMFAGSPLLEMKDIDVRKQFQQLVLDGAVNDGGHTFSTFDRDYTDAPKMEEVETGAGGLPASPYVPNPVSPGEGSMNPSDLSDPPEGFGSSPSSDVFPGVGSLESPKGNSEKQSKHTLGDYKLGVGVGS